MDVIIEDIFVGRVKELAMMDFIWRKALNEKHEHKAYTILNAPGVGKTTLIRKFGEIIERNGQGIHFNYICSVEFTSQQALLKSMLSEFIKMIENNENMILEYIKNNVTNKRVDRIKNRFNNILLEVLEYENREIFMETITSLIKKLSDIIPVFFTSDEIQVFKELKLEGKETALHYYASIIKSFLSNRVLLVLTGTKYHILREIGDTIGSPLKGKVEAEIISPLSNHDIDDFITELNKIIPEYISDTSIEFLHTYLQTFSGGHGRTIEKTVKEFLKFYNKYKNISDYNEFKEIMTENVSAIIETSILSTEKTDKFKELQSRKYFEIVRKWINAGLYNNLRLGHSPRINHAIEQIILDKIVYKFMTIGLIVQNGDQDYYITSYFHYNIFLAVIIGEYEQFMLEIFGNKFLRSIIGGKSGFGYTFENILMATIIINSNRVDNFPILISKIERIDNQLDYKSVNFTDGLMYHTPDTRNIDAIAMINDNLLVLQISTMKSVPRAKMDDFVRELDIIRQDTGKIVEGWFVSLFEIKYDIDEINIIQGKDLIGFMNEIVYHKMLEIKDEL